MDAVQELDLVRRAQSGDQDAVNQILRHLWPAITKAAQRMASNHNEVLEDLRQECAIAIWNCLSRFDPDRHLRFSTYVWPRVHGAMADWWRRQLPKGTRTRPYNQSLVKRQTLSLDRPPPDWKYGAWEFCECSDDTREVDDADWVDRILATVPPKMASAVQLRLRGLKIGQIASLMNISESYVCNLLKSFQTISCRQLSSGHWSPDRPVRVEAA